MLSENSGLTFELVIIFLELNFSFSLEYIDYWYGKKIIYLPICSSINFPGAQRYLCSRKKENPN